MNITNYLFFLGATGVNWLIVQLPVNCLVSGVCCVCSVGDGKLSPYANSGNKLKAKEAMQGLSQDLETGCPKLAISTFLGIQLFKGDHNILRLHP